MGVEKVTCSQRYKWVLKKAKRGDTPFFLSERKEMKFKLYTIDDRYIKYLKMYDNKVSHNYDHNVNKKPY